MHKSNVCIMFATHMCVISGQPVTVAECVYERLVPSASRWALLIGAGRWSRIPSGEGSCLAVEQA